MIKFLISNGEFYSSLRAHDKPCAPELESVAGAGDVTVKHFTQTEAILVLQEHMAKAGYYTGPKDGQWHDPEGVKGRDNFNSAFTKWLREKQFEAGGENAADGWLGRKTLASFDGKVPNDVSVALRSLLEAQVDGQSAYSRLHRRNEYHATGIMLDGMCIAGEEDIPDAAEGVVAHADTIVDDASARIIETGSDAPAKGQVPEKGLITVAFTERADPNTGTKIIPVTVTDAQNWREAGLATLTEDQRKALDEFDGAREQALKNAGYHDAVARRDFAKASLESGVDHLNGMREALTTGKAELAEQLEALRNQPITVTVMGREETHTMASLGDRPFTVFGVPINGSERDLAIHDAISAKYKELLESSGYNQGKQNIDALAHRVNTADSIGGYWDSRRQELKNAELAVEHIQHSVDCKPIQVAITFDMKEGTVTGNITDTPPTPTEDQALSGTIMTGTPRVGNIG